MRDMFVHPRVIERHPELDEESVLSAWRNAIRFARRDRDDGTCYVAVGIDGKGRLVELVALRGDDGFLVYHAMTPPSKKTIEESRLERRCRR